MWGFWKEGGVGLSGSLEAGFTGGLAKFSFRALRLPGRAKRHGSRSPPTCTPPCGPAQPAQQRGGAASLTGLNVSRDNSNKPMPHNDPRVSRDPHRASPRHFNKRSRAAGWIGLSFSEMQATDRGCVHSFIACFPICRWQLNSKWIFVFWWSCNLTPIIDLCTY